MSYEPHLLISFTDLHKHRDRIVNIAENEPTYALNKNMGGAKLIKVDERKAYKELLLALRSTVGEIRRAKFVLIRPELTAHNKRVRKLLWELDIEFTTFD